MIRKFIKLTSKRQATLPAQLCRELGVEPGDRIILERRKIEGEISWILKSQKNIQSKWFGCFQKYAADKEHDMESIRRSIGKSLGDVNR